MPQIRDLNQLTFFDIVKKCQMPVFWPTPTKSDRKQRHTARHNCLTWKTSADGRIRREKTSGSVPPALEGSYMKEEPGGGPAPHFCHPPDDHYTDLNL